MKVTRLSLRNFRCFSRFDINFDHRVSIIAGPNGAGKSSLLEAVHVSGTGRSFRTSNVKDLIQKGATAFSLKVWSSSLEKSEDEIHVGYGDYTRNIKINGNPVFRKDLFAQLNLVTVTEEDIELIQGFPEKRRSFLDHVSARLNVAHIDLIISYLKVLKQRLALLNDSRCWNFETYHILTEQIMLRSERIREARKDVIVRIGSLIKQCCSNIVPEVGSLECTYKVNEREKNYETAQSWCSHMHERERSSKRNLIGAHLDDFVLGMPLGPLYQFGSRGMYKLLAVLLRVAQARIANSLILFDDIMADFDERRLSLVLKELEGFNTQMIFTVPTIGQTLITEWARKYDFQEIRL